MSRFKVQALELLYSKVTFLAAGYRFKGSCKADSPPSAV